MAIAGIPEVIRDFNLYLTGKVAATVVFSVALLIVLSSYQVSWRVFASISTLLTLKTPLSRDMIDAEKYLFKSGIISPLPDQTSEYICFIAGRVAGQPVEFFKGLPPKDITRVKNKVSSFFYGED